MIKILAKNKFTDDEIIKIYENEYIGQHIGGTSLNKKYGVNFYNDFKRLNLQMRTNHDKGKKYTCDTDYFKEINTEEKAYWLGFVYGDGFLSKTDSTIRFGLSIMLSDYQHMIKFKDAIRFNGNINTYEVKTSGYKIGAKYCRIIISDSDFSKNLISHGLVEHKSNIMLPPINIPEKLVRHWIRGFMDSNGSIMISNNEYSIGFTSTKEVLDYIQQHLINNNIYNKAFEYRKRKEEHIVTQMSFGGNNQVKKYLDYIYNDATIWLDRKHDRYIGLCKLLKSKDDNIQIKKCEYCGTENSSEYDMWKHGGEWDGKILCHKHYLQIKKYGKIIPEKKSYCDVCGTEYPSDNLHKLGPSWGEEWFGKNLCEKHYYQLSYHGRITDTTDERRQYIKR